MTVIACITLTLCVLLLMISFAVGPFANEPFFRAHLNFKQLNRLVQKIILFSATILSILCSLWIIGVFA
jgi:hypothetical protein